jgi:hypothetical protein
VEEWPALAWLAKCHRRDQKVTVFHGPKVETTDEWFCEAVWDGAFEDGNFDRTDIVAGSGGRLRDGGVTFVSGGATVDRLQSFDAPDGPLVSNSLACLLASIDARIDETSGRYIWLFRTIVKGVRHYTRQFPTFAGPVALTYFDNLTWNGRELATVTKPGMGRDFSSFARYHGFLQSSLQAVAANASDPRRRTRYDLLSTASSGYDSSTVTVLAKEAGASHVLCFDQARRGIDDSGVPLARVLGMTPILVERSAWLPLELPEVPFVASDSHGGDVFFKGAESTLENKVLLTGYHGDKVWAKEVYSAVDENIVRGDQSGLSLTEYRLTIGMIHCPVSFWGVRQIKDLHAISNSEEMKPWDVPGDYSRPICRRIVESAGMPRESFGQEKKATWVLLQKSTEFMSPSSTRDYLQWLRDRRWTFLSRGRMPPIIHGGLDEAERVVRKLVGGFHDPDNPAWYSRSLRKTGLNRITGRISDAPTRMRRYTFPWALEHQRRAYPGALFHGR